MWRNLLAADILTDLGPAFRGLVEAQVPFRWREAEFARNGRLLTRPTASRAAFDWKRLRGQIMFLEVFQVAEGDLDSAMIRRVVVFGGVELAPDGPQLSGVRWIGRELRLYFGFDLPEVLAIIVAQRGATVALGPPVSDQHLLAEALGGIAQDFAGLFSKLDVTASS